MVNFSINVKIIKNYMTNHNLNEEAFAKKCNIDINVIKKILKNQDVALIYMVKISRITGINYEELFIY